MNEHELDLALADLGAVRVQETAPPALRTQVSTMPLPVPSSTGLSARDTLRLHPFATAAAVATAAVAVLLFGGLLLLVLQPTRDPSPPPAAATESPGPTAAASPDAAILPGTDLVLNEERPGVFAVLSDGVRNLRRNVKDVAITGAGAVYVVKQNDNLYRLGQAGGANPESTDGLREMYISDAGELTVDRYRSEPVVQGNKSSDRGYSYSESLIAGEWVRLEERPYECPAPAGDGSCWFGPEQGGMAIYRMTPGPEWELLEEVGLELEPATDVVHVASHAGGPVYALIYGEDLYVGLASYDGTEWTHAPELPADIKRRGGAGFYLDDAGIAWLSMWTADGLVVLRWDGMAWEVFGPVATRRLNLGMQPVGDATWVGASAALVGSELVPLDLLPPGWRLRTDPKVAPDGHIWLVAANGRGVRNVEYRLYVIDPTRVIE